MNYFAIPTIFFAIRKINGPYHREEFQILKLPSSRSYVKFTADKWFTHKLSGICCPFWGRWDIFRTATTYKWWWYRNINWTAITSLTKTWNRNLWIWRWVAWPSIQSISKWEYSPERPKYSQNSNYDSVKH